MKPTLNGVISLAIFGLVLYALYLVIASILSGTVLTIVALVLVLIFIGAALRVLEVTWP